MMAIVTKFGKYQEKAIIKFRQIWSYHVKIKWLGNDVVNSLPIMAMVTNMVIKGHKLSSD